MDSSCCVIILAGGKSSRMGSPKPFLGVEGKTFVEKLIATYQNAGVSLITVVLNRNDIRPIYRLVLDRIKHKAQIVVNENEVEGRLHSIKLGLKSFRKMDFCFIQNIDNPFTSVTLLEGLYRNRKRDEYVVPLYKGKGGHPILLSEKIMKEIQAMENQETSLRAILSSFKRNEYAIDDPSILLNINTPEDYRLHSTFRSSITT